MKLRIVRIFTKNIDGYFLLAHKLSLALRSFCLDQPTQRKLPIFIQKRDLHELLIDSCLYSPQIHPALYAFMSRS
jgi:hypothetical protein